MMETVLIVDDLEMNVEILESIIQEEGYATLRALNVQEALEILKGEMPQLILSDYSMPGMNGVEFCKLLKTKPATRDIPFILITVADSSEVKRTAFEAGAVDYIPKPFERMEVIMRIRLHIENYRAKQEIIEHNRRMHRVIAEQNALLEKEQEHLLLGLSKVVEKFDHGMGSHLERIGNNCRILAQSLQLTDEYEAEINDAFTEIIDTAAKLYDIGKLAVSDSLLQEMGCSRSPEDMGYVELHAKEGTRLLREIASNGGHSPFLDMAVAIAEYHHARWDGSGWPEGVKGTDIPLAARIVPIICTFDEEYRKEAQNGDALEKALDVIRTQSGRAYDPGIVKVFSKIARQLKLPDASKKNI